MVHADTTLSMTDVNRELYIRNAELAARNKTLSLLHAMSGITTRTLETDDMIYEITHALRKEFTYPFVAMALVDDRKKVLEWKSCSTPRPVSAFLPSLKTLHGIALSSTTNVCAIALAHNRRQSTPDLEKVFGTKVTDEQETFVQATQLQSTLVFPLVSDEKPIGVLALGLDCSVSALSKYERETFQSLLGLITIALQKAETYEHLQRTSKQLRVANRHLRELDAMKTEFLSIASHQLRTPLAVLKGYIGILKSGVHGPLQPKQEETLGRMDAGTEQLILLVNHLLDVSRIESDRLQVRLEPTDLRVILDGLVKFLQAKAQEKGITLVYVMPPAPCMANVDIEKVKEVFMNLLDNAVKYTDEGRVDVLLTSEGGKIHVAVKDTGHGLTQDDQEKLFQKFVTGSASKKVRTTTGLGLYVVKKLVEAMSGEVVAESAGAEQGSTFTVTFPAPLP